MEQGEDAYEHLKAALEALPRLGDERDSIGVRWGLVLACLQRGDPDEAEYWLRQAEDANATQQDDFDSADLGGRAEIALARGLTEVGLGLWRGAVERVPDGRLDARRRPLLRPVGAADPVGGGDGARARRPARARRGAGRPTAAGGCGPCSRVRPARPWSSRCSGRCCTPSAWRGSPPGTTPRRRTDDRAGRTAAGAARRSSRRCRRTVPGRRPENSRRGGVRRRGVGVRRPGAGRVAGRGPRCHDGYFGSRLNCAFDQR